MVKLRARSRKGATGRYRLTMAVETDLDQGMGGAFTDDTEREAAWWALRDELIAKARPGERPEAFWDYEGPSYLWLNVGAVLAERVEVGPNRPGYGELLSLARLQWLHRGGQLTADEIAAIKKAPTDGSINDRRREAIEAIERKVIRA